MKKYKSSLHYNATSLRVMISCNSSSIEYLRASGLCVDINEMDGCVQKTATAAATLLITLRAVRPRISFLVSARAPKNDQLIIVQCEVDMLNDY